MASEDGSWRDKYLKAMEAQDAAERAANGRMDLLRKGLVRVSLAADGVDRTLDVHLRELRKVLRESATPSALEHLFNQIENAVLKLDTRRKQGHETVLQAVEQMVDALVEAKPPRSLTSQLKKISKQAPDKLGAPDEQAELFSQLAKLQKEVILALQPGDEKKAEGGFFKKLFGGAAEEEAPQAAVKADTKADAKAADRYGFESPEDEDLAQTPRKFERASDALDTYEAEVIRERVAGVVFALLDQLNVPPALAKREDAIREKLRQGFSWPEFPETLSETFSLITGSRALAQREFENFLLSLNSRLEDVQGFLARSKQGQDQARVASEKLEFDVRDHIALIQDSIQDSDDIGVLKQTVRSKLDSILSSIDIYRADETTRGTDLVSQIEALSNRMAAMEAEATQLRKTVEEQRENAMKDALTQLPNRQALNEFIEKEYARWQRYGNAISIVILDVDHFKKINDNYGHLAGDKVLKIVAREISKRIRSADFMARYGGEEFVIIMPETKDDDALLAIDKAREYLSSVPFHFKEKRVAVTASFGVTQFREGDTIEAAIARADKALYQAKHEGRNKALKAE